MIRIGVETAGAGVHRADQGESAEINRIATGLLLAWKEVVDKESVLGDAVAGQARKWLTEALWLIRHFLIEPRS